MMLSLNAQATVFVAIKPVDFRFGIHRLGQYCRSVLEKDPLAGSIFVFRNHKRTAIKLITFDGQGYSLLYKIFSCGKLNWWPTDTSSCQQILARDLYILFFNGNPELANMASDWRSVTPPSELTFS